MSKLERRVSGEFNNKKIREYLKEELKLSTRLIRGAALDKRILVNGKAVKLNHLVKEEDRIEIILSKEENQDIIPEKMDLDIVYEDEDLIVINKPPYMVVHPTKGHKSGTLANGVLGHFRENNENCIVRLVSRLDMNTSGLIIIGKNQYAHMALSRDMKREDFKKIYLALVHGKLEKSSGTIDLPIYKEGEDSIKRVVDLRGQRSITHYTVEEEFNDSSLVKLTLETGRTHQIRVHLSHLNCPIYGDSLYGYEEDSALIERQGLHAYGLEFPHPRTGEIIKLTSKLPKDIEDLMNRLKKV
ncbi:RluA family pseudouridine synthase [Clostridium sp.]|uniref:RluA family pseudouridine synthase n=1 Tax=Clostridium sp. TaxID=1506 RepID=UPI0034644F29